MTDSTDPQPTKKGSSGSKPQLRAAALGLLAIAALIAAVTLFNTDNDSNGASGESGSTTVAEATSEPTAQASTTAPPAEPTTAAPAEQTGTPAAPSSTDSTAGQSQPTALPGVTALITSQSWNSDTRSIEVVGAVQGVATQTSTCTATAVMGTTTQKASVEGTFDGQGTSCGLISIPMTGLPSGTYQVVITFESGSGAATSDPVNVNVP